MTSLFILATAINPSAVSVAVTVAVVSITSVGAVLLKKFSK